MGAHVACVRACACASTYNTIQHICAPYETDRQTDLEYVGDFDVEAHARTLHPLIRTLGGSRVGQRDGGVIVDEHAGSFQPRHLVVR